MRELCRNFDLRLQRENKVLSNGPEPKYLLLLMDDGGPRKMKVYFVGPIAKRFILLHVQLLQLL